MMSNEEHSWTAGLDVALHAIQYLQDRKRPHQAEHARMAQRPRRGVSEGDRLARAEGAAEGPVGCGPRAVAAEEALTRFEAPGRLDGAGAIEPKETRGGAGPTARFRAAQR